VLDKSVTKPENQDIQFKTKFESPKHPPQATFENLKKLLKKSNSLFQ
jgi:hypothetical protein